MGIIELFSKRQKRLRGEVPDVYQYDSIPQELRVQVIHIWKDAFGESYQGGDFNPPNAAYESFEFIHDALCREYGWRGLQNYSQSKDEAVANFMLGTEDHEKVIDVLELSFKVIDTYVREHNRKFESKIDPGDAIAELNARFREHGVGYQYESGQIVRVDSQLIHSEVVRPALHLLSDKHFSGANQEFLSAHDHFRARKYKERLTDCLKAFESTMKAICDKRKWSYKKGDTAKTLIGIMLAQGSKPIAVPESIASYALHLTASNIVFLVKAESELK